MGNASNDETRVVVVEIPPALAGIAVRYEILAEIGRGGMGIVYKARDRQTGDLVAVKVLHPAIASSAGLIERFTNELLLARRVTHKNVCRVHDLNEYGGAAVISMEYIDGENLRDVLRRPQGVSIRDGLQIVGQIASGLGEAHAQGVVHRDLKPANILITSDGGVKVVDFGVARSVDSEETIGRVIGTPAYMSPEQAQGDQPDARSDIYSLGLVMYELFCGQPAFTAGNAAALLAKQMRETPRPPRELEPDLPRRVEAAILTCLEKDPGRRYQSVAELKAALWARPAAPASAVAHDEPGLPAHLSAWRRSDTWLAAGAALGVAAFLFAFHRTSLAPKSQVAFDGMLGQRIVQEHLQRLGLPVSRHRSVHIDWDRWTYFYLAKEHGAARARELANNPVPYWEWHNGLEDGSLLSVNNRGDLLSYTRGSSAAAQPNAPPRQDARAIAEKVLMDVWRQPVSGLEVERTSAGVSQNSFVWLNRQAPYGLVERFSVAVDPKGITNMSRTFYPPTGFRLIETRWSEMATLGGTILVSLIGLLYRRRVDAAATWRAAGSACAFVATGTCALIFWNLASTADYVAVSLGFALIGGLAWLLGSMAVEGQIRSTQPARLHTLVRLASRRAACAPCALAILRGTLIGIAVLGIDALAVWIVTRSFGGYLNGGLHLFVVGRTMNGTQWPVAGTAAMAIVQALGIGLAVAFVAAAAERFVGRPWLQWTIATCLLAASTVRFTMAAVEPFHWTAVVLLLDYGILVAAFRRFDLLTVLTAIFTFSFCWTSYALVVMQLQIGPAGPVAAFAVWALFVASAVVILIQSTLRLAYRRLAASLD
jgi:serine/threonine protein kinase